MANLASFDIVKKCTRIYVSCGLAHMAYKILRMLISVRRKRQMIKDVPHSRYADDLMGSAPEMMRNMHRRYEFFQDMAAGKPLCFNSLGPTWDPSLMQFLVQDPAVIKHFLKDNFENYTKAEDDVFWQFLRLWLGQGIFATSHGLGATDGGTSWRRQRKIASIIFNRGNFNDNMNNIFVAKGRRMCELLAESAAQGKPVDMQAKFFQYTMDSIMQIFFGERVDTMGGDKNQYAIAFDSAHRNLLEYFLNSIPILSMLVLLPWPLGGINGLAHKIHRNLNSTYREFLAAYRTLDCESRRIIAATRADERLAERKDLLALFVMSEGQAQSSPKASDGGRTAADMTKAWADDKPLTAEWLRDVVLNMIIAGRDTTACTLSWMFYILATHPEIQRKLQEEIDAKFVAGTVPSIQSVSASELPFLNGVLYESLRLYPPVPIDGKEAVRDDVLPDGTKVPAGIKMTFLVYCMGRDPKRYEEPEVVRPQRWIPFKEPSQYEFPVFQGGPRICVGMNMALFEAKIAALMILREFSFEMAPGEAEKITYLPTALTMSICNSKDTGKFDSHNLWLIPRRRASA